MNIPQFIFFRNRYLTKKKNRNWRRWNEIAQHVHSKSGDGELIVSLTGSEGSYCSTLRFCCSVRSIHTIHIKFVPTGCIFIQYSSFYDFGWNIDKFAVSRETSNMDRSFRDRLFLVVKTMLQQSFKSRSQNVISRPLLHLFKNLKSPSLPKWKDEAYSFHYFMG
ncbi:unnamed protein product [Brugia pahangi]|uniref:SAC domain-containing protein n=1 Tax=Brugia pahangi TaxID=6280 RepID=A0A0N4TIX9_BRUPA|nr:unnamed protein product [Brugia pahangi]